MARLRSAPSSQQNAPAKPSTRQALKEKTNTTSVRASAAEEIKDFVKDARPTRARAKMATQNENELVMAGGLGQRSDVPSSEPPMTTDELAKSDGPPPPTARASRRAPRQARKPAQSAAQSKVFDDMKKRMRATANAEAANDAIDDAPPISEAVGPSSDALPTKPPPAQNAKTTETTERSEFSISPSPPPAGKLSAVKNKRSSTGRRESVLKSQSTPAAETSVLALKNFKRRPRQPSMLAMVQQRVASARPSAAHMQATEVETNDASVFDIDKGDDDEEEEFAPEAEGTPLHLRKVKRTSVLHEKRAPSTSHRQSLAGSATAASRKRKSDGIDLSSSSVRALRAKRQKSITPSRMHEDASTDKHINRHTSVEREETPGLAVESEVQVINSSPAATSSTGPPSPGGLHQSPLADQVVPSTEEELESGTGQRIALHDANELEGQDLPNETMAEPISSSPLPDEPISTQKTDIMAEPLTQVTPPRARREKAQKERKPKPMMTSSLQSLLPKRRQPLRPRHRKSEYDIDSNSDENDSGAGDGSDGDDADERTRRRTKAPPSRNRKAATKSKASTAASRKSVAPSENTRKSTAPPSSRRKTAASVKKASAKTGKTYGRNAASDKENDPTNSDFEDLSDNDDSALPDTSLTMHEAATSGELAAAKAKFAEVDDWDMEFESVSFDEGRSSSQTWR